MTASSSESQSLPPLRTPPGAPEPLIRVVRTTARVREEGNGRGEEVQVFCGSCRGRAYDLTIEMAFHSFYADVSGEWRRTSSAVVERACPKCGVHATCRVTLAPGHPLRDGHHGPWYCPDCSASLAFVDGPLGRIKASCRKCHRNVTTTARNAFFGNLRSVDDENGHRHLSSLDSVPF